MGIGVGGGSKWGKDCYLYKHARIPLYGTVAEFSDAIGTKVLRVFLLAIHSHLY